MGVIGGDEEGGPEGHGEDDEDQAGDDDGYEDEDDFERGVNGYGEVIAVGVGGRLVIRGSIVTWYSLFPFNAFRAELELGRVAVTLSTASCGRLSKRRFGDALVL